MFSSLLEVNKTRCNNFKLAALIMTRGEVTILLDRNDIARTFFIISPALAILTAHSFGEICEGEESPAGPSLIVQAMGMFNCFIASIANSASSM